MADHLLERATFPVAGMTCQACAHTIEGALLGVPGVSKATVSFGARTAEVERDPALAADEALARAVRAAGYAVPAGALGGASSIERDLDFAEAAEARDRARTKRELGLALGFGLPALLAELLGARLGLGDRGWLALLLSAPVQFVAARSVLVGGGRALLRLAPDMNTLVALATTVAWLAAAVAVVGGDRAEHAHSPLHASVLTLIFVLLGRALESRARQRAGSALHRLFELAPPVARVFRLGREVEVPLAEVREGSLVLVRPGERIPVDGEVVEGRSSVDEALLTGESFALDKAPGDRVHAGTQNGLGQLSIRATAVGASSALGRIARAVRQAQGSRADVQRLADRVSAVFVPLVLVVSLTTLLYGWLALGEAGVGLSRAVAVLVVACPCALGLATPMAVMVATGRASREGLLIRDARVFERLARVLTIVFDKTGTLTAGRPRLASIVAAGADERTALALAAAIERGSEQPFARAIVAEAEARGLTVPQAIDFAAEPGRGARARVEGRDLWIGSPRAARERGGEPDELGRLLAPLEARGETAIVLQNGARTLAVFGLLDAPREHARAALERLGELGIASEMCSGDHRAAVERTAGELGLQDWRAEQRPEDKVARVRELAARGGVALVGDGLNDAAALAAADVGIAFGGAADLAVESADAALLREDPRLVPALLVLARRTLATIRVNLAWAFAYNLLALPVAAGVFSKWLGWAVQPHWAALAMAGSSLFVVFYSLRLATISLEQGRRGH